MASVPGGRPVRTSDIAIILPLVVVVAGLIVFLFVSNSRSRRPSDIDEYSHDDDRYWVLGVLYNNPNDPSVFVPKRYSGGLTLNVGNPWGQLMMAGTIVVVVGLALLKAVSSGSGH
jgi:uncharacterized membrane protein